MSLHEKIRKKIGRCIGAGQVTGCGDVRHQYQHYDYWLKRLENNEDLWSGLFENKPIDRESIIVAPTILNSYKNQHEDAYVVYPDAESVLGFLTYIYLPTAFSGVFDHDSADYIIGDDLDDFFREQKINNPNKVEMIKHMESLYNDAHALWIHEEGTLLDNFIEWTNRFNEDWLDIKGIGLSFTIFTSPADLANEVIRVYEEDLDIKMLEEDIGITKEEFINLASDDLYANEFMKRKFTEILTNRLIISL